MTHPVIILVEPQLGENIGAAARVMQNFGLLELKVVNPRDGWPNPQAEAMAVGAAPLVREAMVTATLEEALADIQVIYAATARPRYMVKPVLSSKELGIHLAQHSGRTAIMFGPERTGLTNEHIALANYIVSIPVNPDFSSLNLAQSIAIMSYECFTMQENLPALPVPEIPPLAMHEEVMGFLTHLEETLEYKGFFKTEDKKPGMVNSIRNIFKRIPLTSQDIRTLRGIIRSLSEK